MKRRRRLALLLATMALAVGAVAAGCGDDDDGDSSSAGGDSDLSGTIIIDGSSTVFPLSRAAAEGFNADNSGVQIDVRSSGTGGGFEVFCKGETDISDASRPIAEDEIAACEAAGVAYHELRVGSDGITVVTSADADIGGDDISMEALKAVWEPDSTIKNWDQIPPAGSFNDLALTLAGAGSQSGTYDFFNEEVLGEDAAGETIQPRQDYAASEDDNQTIRTVTSVPGGMGYFGYSYYAENQDALKALSLDGIAPTPETITDGTYPLSRPLFIYVSDASLERPEVAAFARYYLENAVTLAEGADYVPAPQEALDESLATLPAQ
jgi:phosphate transport system substrate-binding protein